MGTTITLTSPDGHAFSAYRADPKASRSKGGIVVVQEIFGVNDHIRQVCDFYASKGYTAIAPAVYDRAQKNYETAYAADDIAKGAAVAGKLNPMNTLMDIKTAATAARPLYRGGSVGIVGYCFGGSMAAAASIQLGDTFASAVSYYGGAVGDMIGEQPKIPLLCHFGKKDTYIPNKIVKKIRAAWTTAIVHSYPAEHGFNCDHRSSYHQASARKAAKRSLDFFALTLSQK
jgi:carboxymethylenebutenolidase